MNTPEHYELYKFISKIIRTALTANINLALVATSNEDSPSVEVENGLCKIYDDNRNERWGYTCSIVNLEGLVPGVYTKPLVYTPQEDIVINNPIVNALLADIGVVGYIKYGSGSLIPITFIVREDTYPAEMYMIINVIKYPPTTVDPNTETSDDTHYKPLTIVGGLDDALGTLDNAYKTNDRTPPTRTANDQGRDTRPSTVWRGLTINNVAFCVYIIETFLSTPRRNRTEFKDFIQLEYSHYLYIPKQVFTPAVIDAINTVYRETSFATSAEVFHYTNRVSSMIVKVDSEKDYWSCRIVSDLLNEMYLVLKSHQQY